MEKYYFRSLILLMILPVMFSGKIFSQSDDDTRESIDLTKEAVMLEEENIAAKYFSAKICT